MTAEVCNSSLYPSVKHITAVHFEGHIQHLAKVHCAPIKKPLYWASKAGWMK